MARPVADFASPAWQDLRSELVRFVTVRVGDPATADDIVHDVLLRALNALRGPEPPNRLRAWLYRSTRNAVIDHYRSRKPEAPIPAGLPENLPMNPAESLPGGLSERDETAERELARCLVPLLGSLRPPYRRALELAELEGLPQKEIARREGLSLSGAKSRVQRARGMLREALLACCRVEVDRRGGVVTYERREAGDPCSCGPGEGA